MLVYLLIENLRTWVTPFAVSTVLNETMIIVIMCIGIAMAIGSITGIAVGNVVKTSVNGFLGVLAYIIRCIFTGIPNLFKLLGRLVRWIFSIRTPLGRIMPTWAANLIALTLVIATLVII